jgi:ABC-2 type transport system ATP-binding protein
VVTGMDSRRIGTIAAEHGVPLHELTPQTVSLEEAFMELTRDAVKYRCGLFSVSRCARAREYLDSDLGSGDLNGALTPLSP